MSPRGVSLVAFRSLTRQRARSAVLILGVALGVAVSFGVSIAAASANKSIAQLVGAEFGSTSVVIGPTEGSQTTTLLAPALLEKVRGLPGVSKASGELGLGVGFSRSGPSTQAASLDGLDFSSARMGGVIPLEAGRLARPGAREVDLPASMAHALGVGLGQQVITHTALHPSEPTSLTVVGLVGQGGAELTAPGLVAFTSVSTAQSLAVESGFNQLDVQLDPGVGADTWITDHRALLGTGVVVLSAVDTESALHTGAKSIQAALTGVSAMALFVCMFLVYLSFSTRVLERTRIYGALYSIGTTSSQLVRAVTSEALMIGLAGGFVGLGLGAALALPTVRLLPTVNGRTPALSVPLSGAITALVAGVLIALVGALSPALRARRLTPIEALRADHEVPLAASRGWVLGLVLLLLGVGLDLVGGPSNPAISLAFLAVLAGATRLVPPLMRPMARLLGPSSARVSPGVGTVAVMHLARERLRSAYTVSLVMVILAMTFAVASGIGAVRHSIVKQIATQYRAQLRVFADHFDARTIAVIRATPGVASATPLLAGNYFGPYLANHQNSPVRISAIDPASYFSTDGLNLSSGSSAGVQRALAAGGVVVMPDTVAGRLHLRTGQGLTLATDSGPRPFVIAGTYADLVNSGAMIISASDAAQYFNSPGPDEVDVLVNRGFSMAGVQASLQHRLSTLGTPAGIAPTTELARSAEHASAQIADLVLGVAIVAGLVGLLGLANTLVMSVIDRTRELGLLRSLGADANRTSTMVLVETATLLGAAVILAVPLAALLTQMAARVTSQATNVPMGTSVPVRIVPGLLAALVVGALAAVAVPLQRVRRLDPVLALRTE